MPLQGQRALVIGASGGIGSAIARRLAQDGSSVVGLGRNAGKLAAVQESLAPGRHAHRACDLSVHAEVDALCAELSSQSQDFDTIVLAAGEFHRASFREADAEIFDRLYSINVRGPYSLLRATLSGVVRKRGQVVFVSSTAALRGRPGWAQYSATQAALRSLAESLRDELNDKQVRVLTVYPGRTATELWRLAALERGELYRPELLLQPEDIAATIGSALCLPRTAEVTDIHIRPFKKCTKNGMSVRTGARQSIPSKSLNAPPRPSPRRSAGRCRIPAARRTQACATASTC